MGIFWVRIFLEPFIDSSNVDKWIEGASQALILQEIGNKS